MKQICTKHLNRLLNPLLLCLLIPMFALALATPEIASAASPPGTKCSSWKISPSPNSSYRSNALQSVAALSSSNAWAVGYAQNSSDGPNQALIEHWNGHLWKLVPSPNIGKDNSLFGVSAVSASNVWAVGNIFGQTTLIEHWNGVQWSVVPSPNAGINSSLNSVIALSARNIWAVGEFSNNGQGTEGTLIEHFDGKAWKVIPSPSIASADNSLTAVAASSARDIWAVGYATASNFVTYTLIEHWNGSQWSIVTSPNPGSQSNYLWSVVALSPRNAWAVGDYSDVAESSTLPTLIEHWDGTSWSMVSSPSVASKTSTLSSVVTLSANNILAIGDAFDSGSSTSLVEHWNGTTWSIVPSVNTPTSFYDFLFGAVRIPHTEKVWIVGYSADTSNNNQTLIERKC